MARGQVVIAATHDLGKQRKRLDSTEKIGRPPATLQSRRVRQALIEGFPAELGIGVASKQNGRSVHYGKVRDGTVRESPPGALGQRRTRGRRGEWSSDDGCRTRRGRGRIGLLS